MSNTDMETGHEELWKQVFGEGHPVLLKKQKRFLSWPSDPRCKMCYAPFGGFGGLITRLTGLMPSDRNPHYCNKCDGFLQAFPGGAEVDMTMLILDIRGSVELSGRIPPRQFAETVNAMREITSAVIAENRGFILEFQGDSVVAVFPPGFTGADHAAMGLAAAKGIVNQSVKIKGTDEVLPIGVAVHTGPIYICTVTAAGGNMQGVSVFGQGVNYVARLAASAAAGNALISSETYAAAGRDIPENDMVDIDLKGIEGTSRAVQLS